MTVAEEAVRNRTFLMPNRNVNLDVRVRAPDSGGTVHPEGFQTMGQADPAFVKSGRRGYMRTFSGYRWTGNGLASEQVQEWPGQEFYRYATAWEKQWSAMMNSAAPMFPVLADTGELVAHVGKISTSNIAFFPLPGKKVEWVMTNDVIRTFGMKSSGFSDTSGTFVTTADGQVVTLIGKTSTRGVEAEDVSPIDIIFAVKALVDLGAAGIRLITVLQEKAAARKVLSGVTAEMARHAKDAEKHLVTPLSHTGMPVSGVYSTAKGMKFHILQVGPAIPGTKVPEWLRIRIGAREFLVGREAMAMDRARNPMGAATKHIANRAKKDAKRLGLPGDAEFPTQKLADGLKDAENQIMQGLAPQRRKEKFPEIGLNVSKKSPVRGPVLPGEYLVTVEQPGFGFWEFGIDVDAQGGAWKVFHAEIGSKRKIK